ncbi:MAG TPA: RtcB family protein [Pirellulaceae bacterium]|nr:RtcB family protein [Pirellulaceae bacterium]HMO91424.1 RtcB family protein [Pirellulaceae bacterium]HMP69499.1 RtcB family protein [Pirellulaceae bacterium]
MNKKQLIQLGIPADCVAVAIECVQFAAQSKTSSDKPKRVLPKVAETPELYLNDPHFAKLAEAIVNYRRQAEQPEVAVEYRQWGSDIDTGAIEQIQDACRLPISVAAALMPDAHIGYGLPIGGVLACNDALIPYAVGVDIACRMKMTITDIDVDLVIENHPQRCGFLDAALQKGTLFGTGKSYANPFEHAVMDEDWNITAVTRTNKDRAWAQLGTSGSGNHFVEWGEIELFTSDLGIDAGRYVALLSHSGSRGTGAAVCQRYSDIARNMAPHRIRDDKRLRHLAWLPFGSQEGQEYWQAMNLMGKYASANHQIIHQQVTRLAGASTLASVENHHNFAWLEELNGEQVFVHRKGATPAGLGDLGVIPGSMADSAYIVCGKGNLDSINSASHGAGRRMSRQAAMNQFKWSEWRNHLAHKNVRLLAGGLDEVPGAYKNIHEVMAAQADLVEVLGEFFPRIVMMCGDGSRAED